MKISELYTKISELFSDADACDKPKATFEHCKSCRKEFCQLRKEKPRDSADHTSFFHRKL